MRIMGFGMEKDFVFAGFKGEQSGHCDWKVVEEIEKKGGQMRVGGEETPNKHIISASSK